MSLRGGTHLACTNHKFTTPLKAYATMYPLQFITTHLHLTCLFVPAGCVQ